MKHGKTKEQEAEEVALVQALAEKRLREVCNLFSERNLGQNWKDFLQPLSELEIFLQP